MAASVKEKSVELGFAEECFSWKLTSKYFPSKIGGKPAWLDLKNLPTTKELSCKKCGNPCVFLLQIYSPDEELDTCYHRSIFLFVCKNPICSEKHKFDNILVFRCQLPRENESYGFEPYEEDENDPNPCAENFKSLCHVCGCVGALKCSKCQFRSYCCENHQRIDWKAGHSKECKSIVNKDTDVTESRGSEEFLLPEYEIVMEEEPEMDTKPKKTEEDALKEYKTFLTSEKAKSVLPESSESNELLEQLATKEDKIFQKFVARTRIEPQQVLRYQKTGKPLWVSAENVPKDENVPKCDCGADRIFEFQVMPQLLNHLKLDDLDHSIDWGVLAVYTCSLNCDKGNVYHPEFVWKQDI